MREILTLVYLGHKDAVPRSQTLIDRQPRFLFPLFSLRQLKWGNAPTKPPVGSKQQCAKFREASVICTADVAADTRLEPNNLTRVAYPMSMSQARPFVSLKFGGELMEPHWNASRCDTVK